MGLPLLSHFLLPEFSTRWLHEELRVTAALVCEKSLEPEGDDVKRRKVVLFVTEEEVRGVLLGWLQTTPELEHFVRSTVKSAFWMVRSDIELTISNVDRMLTQLVAAKEDLVQALRYAQTSGDVQWRSQAATVFQWSLLRHVMEVGQLIQKHETEISRLLMAKRELTTLYEVLSIDHPSVLKMADRTLNTVSFVAAEAIKTAKTVTAPLSGLGW